MDRSWTRAAGGDGTLQHRFQGAVTVIVLPEGQIVDEKNEFQGVPAEFVQQGGNVPHSASMAKGASSRWDTRIPSVWRSWWAMSVSGDWCWTTSGIPGRAVNIVRQTGQQGLHHRIVQQRPEDGQSLKAGFQCVQFHISSPPPLTRRWIPGRHSGPDAGGSDAAPAGDLQSVSAPVRHIGDRSGGAVPAEAGECGPVRLGRLCGSPYAGRECAPADPGGPR